MGVYVREGQYVLDGSVIAFAANSALSYSTPHT